MTLSPMRCKCIFSCGRVNHSAAGATKYKSKNRSGDECNGKYGRREKTSRAFALLDLCQVSAIIPGKLKIRRSCADFRELRTTQLLIGPIARLITGISCCDFACISNAFELLVVRVPRRGGGQVS